MDSPNCIDHLANEIERVSGGDKIPYILGYVNELNELKLTIQGSPSEIEQIFEKIKEQIDGLIRAKKLVGEMNPSKDEEDAQEDTRDCL